MILCLLRKPETSHLPETGFVYNGIEASDALVCRYHVSELRGAGRCATSLWDRWLSVLGWNPGSMVQQRQLTSIDHGSARFSAELSQGTSMLLFQFDSMCDGTVHFISGKCQAHAAGHRKSSGQTCLTPTCQKRWWQDHCVVPAVQHPCPETLCWYCSLAFRCYSVHWCHHVYTMGHYMMSCSDWEISYSEVLVLVLQLNRYHKFNFNLL